MCCLVNDGMKFVVQYDRSDSLNGGVVYRQVVTINAVSNGEGNIRE